MNLVMAIACGVASHSAVLKMALMLFAANAGVVMPRVSHGAAYGMAESIGGSWGRKAKGFIDPIRGVWNVLVGLLAGVACGALL